MVKVLLPLATLPPPWRLAVPVANIVPVTPLLRIL
jgi:hypothetical protein